MSDVSGVTGTTSTTTSSATSSTGTTAEIGKEFNSFIQLLTAQVKNQDPLSPMDSTQFVEQLATFSSLEQQVRANTNLENIGSLVGDLYSIVASDWVQQNVPVATSWVPFSGDAVDFVLDLPDAVDQAILTVSDSDGNVVWTETLDPGEDSYTWAGELQASDDVAPNGDYEFAISAFQEGVHIGTVAPRVVTYTSEATS